MEMVSDRLGPNVSLLAGAVLLSSHVSGAMHEA